MHNFCYDASMKMPEPTKDLASKGPPALPDRSRTSGPIPPRPEPVRPVPDVAPPETEPPAAPSARPGPARAVPVRGTPPGAAAPLASTIPAIRTGSDEHEDDRTPDEAAQDEAAPDEAALGPPPNFLRNAPPWLVSFIFHTALLIALALLVIPQVFRRSVEIDAVFAEELGEQLDDASFDLPIETPSEDPEQAWTPDMLPPVDDPLAAPPEVAISREATSSTSDVAAPMVGLALLGRQKGMKRALLAGYGGNATTEAAVGRGLEWLARNQNRDGTWSLTGPYSGGAHQENKVAATAMALLAFQGAGSTHKDGKYQTVVDRAGKTLLEMQDKDGNFWPDLKGREYRSYNSNHRLYSQAQATIALCELYGMSRDESLREPAQRAVNYAVKVQDAAGGWRYYPGQDSDTSVTGWFVMALQSGLMAGLEVPSPTLDRVSKYLDKAAVDDGSRYAYRPGEGARPAMTAEGLLCRQYLGWKHDDRRLIEGVNVVNANPINWNNANVYYWYYATQVAHHMEGRPWKRWNGVMRQVIPENQVMTGKERGSWYPDTDRWAPHGGRLFSTCLCIYMLEVYYRHLPVYSPVYRQGF